MPDTVEDESPIRPLKEILPHIGTDLDGTFGENRAAPDRLQIEVRNDYEAIAAFLGEYDQSPNTHKAYANETERLALWAYHEVKKPISSLTRQDFEGYMTFLMDPQPETRWCAPTVARANPKWRPFAGPLQESGVTRALAAINSMMAYWVDAGYILGNPLGLIRQRRRKMAAIDQLNPTGQRTSGLKDDADAVVERYLDDDMWDAVMRAIEASKVSHPDEYERTRFIFSFLKLLAPRVNEMESHTMSSFRKSGNMWWWHVIGKGAKRSKVPLPDDMVTALFRYRESLGLSPAPSPTDTSPILRSLRYPGKGIKANWLNVLLKRIFTRAIDELPPEKMHKKVSLEKASTHWGRHTGITSKINSGMDPRYVQRDARHADFRTTQRYIHEGDEDRHGQAQKQRLDWQSSSDKRGQDD